MMQRNNYARFTQLSTPKLICLAVCFACLLPGCGGNGQSNVALEQTGDAALTISQPSPDFELAPPNALPGTLDAPRQSSYVEEDLIHYGKFFSLALPNANVAGDGNNAKFTTTWDAGVGGLAGLGYGMYDFTIAGYDRAPEVHFGWADAPANPTTVWMGLANWSTDRWDWFQCDAANMHSFASFADYIQPVTDRLVVVMVMANAEETSLNHVRLGPHPLTAHYVVLPSLGVVPYSTTLTGSFTASPVSDVVRYEWDLDIDGTFEIDGGSVTNQDVLVDTAGEHSYGLRVTDEFGYQSEYTDVVNGYAAWQHSWGNGDLMPTKAVVASKEHGIIAVGRKKYLDDSTDAVLIRYDLEGNFQWGKLWGTSDYEEYTGVTLGADGSFYVVGQTRSFGAGGYDILLQRWDTTGNLIWTKTWGGGGIDTATGVLLTRNMLFVVGYTSTYGEGSLDALLIRFDLDGVEQWARTLGAGDSDRCTALDDSFNIISSTTSIHLTGYSESWGTTSEIVYAVIKENGTLTMFKTWTNGMHAQGMDINNSGIFGGNVYICGEGNYDEVLVLEPGGSIDKLWTASDSASGRGILRRGDSILLCGSVYDSATKDDGFLLQISTTGSLEGAQLWQDPSNDEVFEAMTYFPGSGLVFAGECDMSANASWVNTTGTYTDAGGSWTNRLIVAGEHNGAMGQPVLAAVDVTDGVLDTGFGASSTAVVLRP